MIRTFLAVNFPVSVVRRVVDEVRALAPSVEQAGLSVAWVPAANVHLTLKFLGGTKPDAVEGIAGELSRRLAGRPTFDVEVRGMGAFPSVKEPRVLWAGVRTSAALAALQQDVETWMNGLGFAREERAFHPHLTVGRVKSEAPVAGADAVAAVAGTDIVALLGARESLSFGSARVAEVVLYESRTLRTGAEYVALARCPFSNAAREATQGSNR